MSAASPGIVRRVLRRALEVIDTTRRVVLNLIFLLVLVVVLTALFSDGVPHLHARSALVLELRGALVDQATGSVGERLREELEGQFNHEVQLRDVLRALEAAATDPKIERVLLLLDEFEGAGMPTLREVAMGLQKVKAAGKQVIAWGANYDQRQYFLASQAHEVYLDPMGMVYLRGFGGLRSYYKDALDRLGVQANVFRAGKYKNAAEVFSDRGPSDETRESDALLYDGLWALWTQDVEKARGLPQGSINDLIDEVPQRLAAVQGDAARLALEAKWVDGLKTEDELRQLLIERGAYDEGHDTFEHISLEAYLLRQPPQFGGPAVGVVVAQGEISDGEEGPGRIGGRSTAELIRQAREDDAIHALVLRVNSPGGSAFGSELVRRELKLTQEAGKPVVVSMGDVAASGGYWISMAADEVIADAATVTGSIGVVALLPTAKEAMDKLSVHTDGHTTTWLAGAYDPRTGIDPRFAAMVRSGIAHTYGEFLRQVASARNAEVEQIDDVAQGRVWTGAQALDLGLVDRLGGLTEAVQSAARMAQLEGNVRVTYIEQAFSPYARLLEMLGASAAQRVWAGVQAGIERHWAGGLLGERAVVAPEPVRQAARDLGWLMSGAQDVAAGRKPYVAAVHCFCSAVQ